MGSPGRDVRSLPVAASMRSRPVSSTKFVQSKRRVLLTADQRKARVPSASVSFKGSFLYGQFPLLN